MLLFIMKYTRYFSINKIYVLVMVLNTLWLYTLPVNKTLLYAVHYCNF